LFPKGNEKKKERLQRVSGPSRGRWKETQTGKPPATKIDLEGKSQDRAEKRLGL